MRIGIGNDHVAVVYKRAISAYIRKSTVMKLLILEQIVWNVLTIPYQARRLLKQSSVVRLTRES